MSNQRLAVFAHFWIFFDEKYDNRSKLENINSSNIQNTDNFFKNPSQFLRSYNCNESTASNLNQNKKNNSNKIIPVIYISSVTENFEEEERNEYNCPNYFKEEKIIEDHEDPSDCNLFDTNEYNNLYNINKKITSHTLSVKKVGLGRFSVNTEI